MVFLLFKQKTAYEVRISDWSSDVCSSDLHPEQGGGLRLCRRHVYAGWRRAVHPPKRQQMSRTVDNGDAQANVHPLGFVDGGFQRHFRTPAGQGGDLCCQAHLGRSEEHTSELQSLMRISYAVFCLKKKNNNQNKQSEIKFKKH